MSIIDLISSLVSLDSIPFLQSQAKKRKLLKKLENKEGVAHSNFDNREGYIKIDDKVYSSLDDSYSESIGCIEKGHRVSVVAVVDDLIYVKRI